MRYKRLETGHFAAPWKRPGEGALELTMSELSLLLEGSELALRVRLSPEPYRPMQDERDREHGGVCPHEDGGAQRAPAR